MKHEKGNYKRNSTKNVSATNVKLKQRIQENESTLQMFCEKL